MKKPLIDIGVTLGEINKRIKSVPDPLTTKQEKRKLIKEVKALRDLITDQGKRIETFFKKEEEFQRTLLSELKKEHINVRPSQGKPLSTVVWAKGRKTKPIKPPPTRKKGGGRKK